jgi:ubiquinone/menaquinone biosynthesis C-methylase UbiE
MKKYAVPHLEEQEKVNAYFQSRSSFWKDLYAGSNVFAEIHRCRQAAVLNWIDGLALAPGSQVLEVGCGAGFMAVALAQRGLRVHAIDPVEDMVELARRHAAESGVAEALSVDVGNIYALAFDDGSFELVIALGVIPWLERAEQAIQEMARVTRLGGYVILTADNRVRLNHILDPWLNPVLSPLKQPMKSMLEWVGLRRRLPNKINSTLHDRRFIDKTMARFELAKTDGMMLGFGPFSLFSRRVLPEPLGIALHHWLQCLADRHVPIFRSTGAQYLVLTRKQTSRPLANSTSAEETFSEAVKVL